MDGAGNEAGRSERGAHDWPRSIAAAGIPPESAYLGISVGGSAREVVGRESDESLLAEETRDATEAATRRVVAAGCFSGTDADAGAGAGAGAGARYLGDCY